MPPGDSGRAEPLPPGRLAVHVLGPPRSGKAEVSAALAETFGGEVFHIPTAAARRAATDPAFAARARAEVDSLGFLDPPLVGQLLEEEPAAGLLAPSRPGPLVVQGFPGIISQVRPWLQLVARYPGTRLAALELRITDPVLTRRAAARLTCPSCQPDPGLAGTAAPRPPAATGVGAGTCGSCGGPLVRGPGVAPEVFANRLRRYRRGAGPIRAAGSQATREAMAWVLMTSAGVTWYRLDVDTLEGLRNAGAAACAAVAPCASHDPTFGGSP